MQFDNLIGFYAFTGLVALILVYMIKPKAVDVKIPSLMFLMKQKGTRQKSTFFKKLNTNLLFFLQFLIIALLAFAATSPLIDMKYDSTSENTVIVLDVSASMQTKQGSSTRFVEAVDRAKDYVRGSTTLILAESVPLIVLEGGSEAKAREILTRLQPKETSTNLGDAMILANDLLGGSATTVDGRVIVVSDFMWTEGADPEVIKTMLESKGIVVDFINVGKGGVEGGNVGFVDLEVRNRDTTFYVKNYFDSEQTIKIELKNENTTLQPVSKRLLPHSVETVTIPTQGGVTIAHITGVEDDVLKADDYLFINNPKKTTTKVLMLSNKPNKFLKTALEASGGIEVSTSEPPVIPDIEAGKFDVVIINDVEPEKMLSGTIDQLEKHVANGNSLIVTYQESIKNLKLGDLLPLEIDQVLGESPLHVAVENQFTKDVSFGSVKAHYKAEVANSTIVLATAQTSGSPVIVIKADQTAGGSSGKIMYYGIDDLTNDFKNAPSYPIFWNNVIHFMLGIESLSNFNHKTGKVFAFDREIPVITPHNTVTTSKLVLDNAGVYGINGMRHAANTVDEKESDVFADISLQTTQAETYEPKEVIKERKVNLEIYLLIAALVLIVGELIYSKFRGDF